MLFYITSFIIFLSILIHQYVTFIRIYYSNLTLQKLREINYDATLFLSENAKENMSINSIDLYRGLIAILGHTISEAEALNNNFIRFKDLKIIFVSFNLLAREKGTLSIAIDGNTLAKKYVVSIQDAINTSIKAIPFFFWRLFFYAIKSIIYHLLVKAGFKSLKTELESINSILAFYKWRLNKSEYTL